MGKKKLKSIKIIVEATKDGYSAFTKDITGIYTVGENLDDLKNMLVDAINLYFEDEDKYITKDGLVLLFDIPSFFGLNKVINASALAKRIGMGQSLLAQYISGKKNPSQEQTKRILMGIKQVGKELASMDFRI